MTFSKFDFVENRCEPVIIAGLEHNILQLRGECLLRRDGNVELQQSTRSARSDGG